MRSAHPYRQDQEDQRGREVPAAQEDQAVPQWVSALLSVLVSA